MKVKTSPSISLSLSQRTFAGGVSFFVYICWLLVAAAWCCQNFLPNLYAALLAAAPLRALFLALAFALAFALANNLCRWCFFRCWLLGVAAWWCLTSAALLAAAPLRALFLALASACYFHFCDTSACACMHLHSHLCVIGCARFSFSKRKECLKRE